MSAALASGCQPGVVLGSWRLVDRLGQGGMGEVFRAEHVYLPTRKAAVKVLLPERVDAEGFAERFHTEAAALASLDHPNVVRLYDANVTGGVAWMAMELLNGATLAELLEQRHTLSTEDTLQILAEIADGVHAAHLIGVVHRDLKPSNVFITHGHVVKVLDFGTVKLAEKQTPLAALKHETAQNVVIGTCGFMSPEQVLGKPPLDHRSDIFSLGVVGYCMLSGRHPFISEGEMCNPQVLLYRAIIMDPAPLTEIVPGCRPEVWGLLDLMLAKNRDHRPATMIQLARQLRELRERLRVAGGQPVAELRSLAPPPAVPSSGPVARGALALVPAPAAPSGRTSGEGDTDRMAPEPAEGWPAASEAPRRTATGTDRLLEVTPAVPAARTGAVVPVAPARPPPITVRRVPWWRVRSFDRLVQITAPGRGAVHPLVGARVRLGRAAEAGVSIDEPSLGREHCELIRLGDGGWEVHDLGSVHGVRINGVAVRCGTLRPGQELRCGELRFRYLPANPRSARRIAGGLVLACLAVIVTALALRWRVPPTVQPGRDDAPGAEARP